MIFLFQPTIYNKEYNKTEKDVMNTYIAIRPYIASQIIEQLKKFPYTDVCGLIGELNEAMNYPVQLNWNQPVEVGEGDEKKKEQRKPIGFTCAEENIEGDGDEEPDDEPTIVCKPEKQRKTK